jgi:hypothetical protein
VKSVGSNSQEMAKPSDQSPECRADVEDSHVGDSNNEDDKRAEGEATCESGDEGRLQHPQQHQPAKSSDEGPGVASINRVKSGARSPKSTASSPHTIPAV